jgi:hypothetical protein
MRVTKEYKELKELLVECDEMQTTLKTKYEFNNTWIRRYFRLYLDGSYSNYNDYRNNCEFLKKHQNNVKKLRMFIKNKFIDFLSVEFSDLSAYKIEKTIKEAFLYNKTKTNLELFNCNLIEDALELIQE